MAFMRSCGEGASCNEVVLESGEAFEVTQVGKSKSERKFQVLFFLFSYCLAYIRVLYVCSQTLKHAQKTARQLPSTGLN